MERPKGKRKKKKYYEEAGCGKNGNVITIIISTSFLHQQLGLHSNARRVKVSGEEASEPPAVVDASRPPRSLMRTLKAHPRLHRGLCVRVSIGLPSILEHALKFRASRSVEKISPNRFNPLEVRCENVSIAGGRREGARVDGLARAGRRRLVEAVAVSLHCKSKRTIVVQA